MAPPTKCLYETLQIPVTATESEIKKAYRLQALAHHPDKNPDRQEQAEEAFKQIQHAYGVLSDPHERAWYDAHRDQILRGKDPNSEETQASSATEVNLFAYFSSSAWKGYEGDGGFYDVFQTLFEQLWKEETAASEKEKARPAPSFGSADTPWEEVREFYQEWEPFSSSKSFAFADKWNLADAPNREYRRAMEKENKRQRAKFKKEFNNDVRELVKFVKKRDPRVIKRREQEEREREAREKARKERETIEKEERRDEAQRVREAREAVLEEDADALDEILAGIALDEKIERRQQRRKARGTSDQESESDTQDEQEEDDSAVEDEEQFSSEEEAVLEDLYCVACKKAFRTLAQKADHERSKKHKTAMTKMKRQVLKEEEDYLAMSGVDAGDDQHISEPSGDIHSPPFDAQTSKSKKKRKRKAKMQTSAVLEEQYVDEGQEDESEPSGPNEGEKESCEGKPESKQRVLSKKEKRKLREEKKKAAATVHKCNVCAEEFPSRTKLMKHVNTMGHALHVERRR
ncbi:Heat shock protein tDnaJ [Gracilaria domingensis]|nr:Heat shock protein tDnaJ [Gracilaria domingensis]